MVQEFLGAKAERKETNDYRRFGPNILRFHYEMVLGKNEYSLLI